VWSGVDHTALANVRFLSLARRLEFIDPVASMVVTSVVTESMTIAKVCELAAIDGVSRQSAMPAILAQLWTSAWGTDLAVPLTGDSVITRVSSAA
jgi:hypothetical protein